MLNFDTFLSLLKTDLSAAAEEYGRDYVSAVVEDGTAFAVKIKDRLEERGRKLEEGNLSEDEFRWLLNSDKNLIEMEATKQHGLAVIQLNKIQDAIIGAVAGALVKSVKI